MEDYAWDKFDEERYRKVIKVVGGKKFNGCHAFTVEIGNYEVFVSYYTVVAVRNKVENWAVINPEKFSRTTTNQLHKFIKEREICEVQTFDTWYITEFIGEEGEGVDDITELRLSL